MSLWFSGRQIGDLGLLSPFTFRGLFSQVWQVLAGERSGCSTGCTALTKHETGWIVAESCHIVAGTPPKAPATHRQILRAGRSRSHNWDFFDFVVVLDPRYGLLLPTNTIQVHLDNHQPSPCVSYGPTICLAIIDDTKLTIWPICSSQV